MRVIQKTLAIIALLILVAQSVRHSYLRWFEPRISVLDKYDRPLRREIAAAASLDDLMKRYEPIRKQADEARRQRQAKTGEPSIPGEESFDGMTAELELHRAIQDWEEKAKEIHELRFYCTVGFALLLLGAATYRWANTWLGLALEIAAFSEVVYWTSPTFFGGAGREFDRLLSQKLFFSVAGLALLLGTIWEQRVFSDPDPQAGTTRDS